MNLKVREIIDTSTFKQSSITFFGTAANGALGAVFYILAARLLGPAAFGLLTVAIAALTLVSDISDLGTDTGLVRFVGKYFHEDRKKALQFLKLGLKVKIAVWLTVLTVGYFLAPTVAGAIFAKAEMTSPLRLAFIGVGSTLLFSLVARGLQGMQRFVSWSFLQVGTNALRVIVFVLVAIWLGINLNKTLIVYIVVPLVGAILGGIFLLPNFLKVEGERKLAKEFFHYNGWVAAFILVAAFSSRLDTFISARLLSQSQLGLYGAANQLVTIVPQIVSALGIVFAPKMASMGTVRDLINYLKKTFLFVSGLAGLGLVSIPVVLFLIPILFGQAYSPAGSIFVILLFAQLVYLISVPIHMSVFYYFAYPKLFFWVSLGHLVIIGGLGWPLVLRFGAQGAALAVLAGSVFNFAVPAAWVLKKVRG